MPAICIMGLQWGDEGKGKLVDALCEKVDYVVRYQGGANAGHTVVFNGKNVCLPTEWRLIRKSLFRKLNGSNHRVSVLKTAFS